jgi:hypothetical protein
MVGVVWGTVEVVEVVLVVLGEVVVVVLGEVVVVVLGEVVVVVLGEVVVVVLGEVVVVVLGEVVVEEVDEAVDVVVGGGVVVVVAAPGQTCVTLNVDPSWPFVTCAVALRIVSFEATFTFTNFGLLITVPLTVRALWNVAERLTKASPCEAGSTRVHPGSRVAQLKRVPDTLPCPGFKVAFVVAALAVRPARIASAARAATIDTVPIPASHLRREPCASDIWPPRELLLVGTYSPKPVRFQTASA